MPPTVKRGRPTKALAKARKDAQANASAEQEPTSAVEKVNAAPKPAAAKNHRDTKLPHSRKKEGAPPEAANLAANLWDASSGWGEGLMRTAHISADENAALAVPIDEAAALAANLGVATRQPSMGHGAIDEAAALAANLWDATRQPSMGHGRRVKSKASGGYDRAPQKLHTTTLAANLWDATRQLSMGYNRRVKSKTSGGDDRAPEKQQTTTLLPQPPCPPPVSPPTSPPTSLPGSRPSSLTAHEASDLRQFLSSAPGMALLCAKLQEPWRFPGAHEVAIALGTTLMSAYLMDYGLCDRFTNVQVVSGARVSSVDLRTWLLRRGTEHVAIDEAAIPWSKCILMFCFMPAFFPLLLAAMAPSKLPRRPLSFLMFHALSLLMVLGRAHYTMKHLLLLNDADGANCQAIRRATLLLSFFTGVARLPFAFYRGGAYFWASLRIAFFVNFVVVGSSSLLLGSRGVPFSKADDLGNISVYHGYAISLAMLATACMFGPSNRQRVASAFRCIPGRGS